MVLVLQYVFIVLHDGLYTYEAAALLAATAHITTSIILKQHDIAA